MIQFVRTRLGTQSAEMTVMENESAKKSPRRTGGKVIFRLKKQLLIKRKFFYCSGVSEAEKEIRVSEFGGEIENSSIKTLKLELKLS